VNGFEAGMRMFRYHCGVKQKKELFHAARKQSEMIFNAYQGDASLRAEILGEIFKISTPHSLV